MKWSDITAELQAVKTVGNARTEIRGVQYDSRRVGNGDVFVAMRGGSTDGNRFVDTALQQGAAAIVTDSAQVFDRLHNTQPDLPIALAEHGRRALAEVSGTVFGHPERDLKLSAVTGTNGKTTTTFLLEQLLASAGRKTVLLGTIETHIAGEIRPTEHTTPESRDIYAVFADGVKAGCTEAVMEMSSHALEQERVWGLPVDVAIFTNLTQDHLDFHGTMEAYFTAKAKLFQGVGAAAPRIAIVNADDPYADGLRDVALRAHGEVWMYGLEASSNHAPQFRAERISVDAGFTSFDFATPEETVRIRSRLSGRVNVTTCSPRCAPRSPAASRSARLRGQLLR